MDEELKNIQPHEQSDKRCEIWERRPRLPQAESTQCDQGRQQQPVARNLPEGARDAAGSSHSFKYIGHRVDSQQCHRLQLRHDDVPATPGILWVGIDNDGVYGVNPDGTQYAHYLNPVPGW